MKNTTNEIQIFQYNNNPIAFQVGEHKMINATQMARGFGSGKRPKNFLALQSTKEIILALSKGRNLPLADLVTVSKGGSDSETWMHEDLAIVFAQWLSPEFYIWCNSQLKELLTNRQALLDRQHQAELDEAKALIKFQTERGTKNYSLYKDLEKQLQNLQTRKSDTSPTQVKLYKMADIAKELGLSEQELCFALLEEGVIVSKPHNNWELTKYYRGKSYVRTRYKINDRFVNANTHCGRYLTWTEAGRRLVLDMMIE